jgi:DNA repair protein RecO (recombination protein O)
MKQIVTHGMVLSRTDYGEADRVLNFLTSGYGKVSAIAKGVRKSKSKLAGGIELFSISELSFIVGKSDIYTITSARLVKHYGNIVKDLERTKAGYELIRLINKNTEDNPEKAYFDLLNTALGALDDSQIDLQLINLWFSLQLIKLAGHTPNLYTDMSGSKLTESKKYDFDFERMQFNKAETGRGKYTANHIKFIRLVISAGSPQLLAKVQDYPKLIQKITPLTDVLAQNSIRS